MYLMPLNYSLKMGKMINFMLYVFYYNLFKKERKKVTGLEKIQNTLRCISARKHPQTKSLKKPKQNKTKNQSLLPVNNLYCLLNMEVTVLLRFALSLCLFCYFFLIFLRLIFISFQPSFLGCLFPLNICIHEVLIFSIFTVKFKVFLDFHCDTYFTP